jgi:hypothetical protein
MHSHTTSSFPFQSPLIDQRLFSSGIEPPLLVSPVYAFKAEITHNSSKLEIIQMETNPANGANA